LDFWNNSYAIPADKKQLYGWIKTDSIIETSGGDKGALATMPTGPIKTMMFCWKRPHGLNLVAIHICAL
jgi:hypothetical protein